MNTDYSRSDGPILAGVVGNPVGHSLSPLIHSHWAHAAGVSGYYIPVQAPTSYPEFAAVIDGLRQVGFAGVNVTLPHKENAFRYAHEKTERAMLAAAANMLTFREGAAYADNSDATGFTAALRAVLAEGEIPERAVVLGAGGAARGIILALKDAGCGRIVIANRTRAKAQALAEAFSLDAVADWADREEALAHSAIVVNTTSLGMTGEPPLEIDLSALPSDAIVADIVYSPLETALLRQAAAANRRTVDGLAMLMHQAAPGFRQWFSASAVVDDALRRVLTDELKRRARG